MDTKENDKIGKGIEKALEEQRYGYYGQSDAERDIYSPESRIPENVLDEISSLRSEVENLQKQREYETIVSKRYTETVEKLEDLLKRPEYKALESEKNDIFRDVKALYDSGIHLVNAEAALIYRLGQQLLKSLKTKPAEGGSKQSSPTGPMNQNLPPEYVPFGPTPSGGSVTPPTLKEQMKALKDMSSEELEKTFGDVKF